RRQAVLLLARHLAEGAWVPVRQKHRIVAETLVAAWRPYQHTVDAALEGLNMTVRPGDAERRDEVRGTRRGRRRAEALQLLLDVAHGAAEILVGAGPARRMDARRAAERIDHEAGIVGERRELRGFRGRRGLDQRVFREGRAGLLGLGEAELAGGDRGD